MESNLEWEAGSEIPGGLSIVSDGGRDIQDERERVLLRQKSFRPQEEPGPGLPSPQTRSSSDVLRHCFTWAQSTTSFQAQRGRCALGVGIYSA